MIKNEPLNQKVMWLIFVFVGYIHPVIVLFTLNGAGVAYVASYNTTGIEFYKKRKVAYDQEKNKKRSAEAF
jgi:hypothetical protein